MNTVAEQNIMRQTLERVFAEKVVELGLENYYLEYGNRKSALGTCHYNKKIVISNYFLKYITMEKAYNTLLHELSHALSFKRHGVNGRGHGNEWKQACRDLGIEPKRVANVDIPLDAYKYNITCEHCGTQWGKHKLPRDYEYYYHCKGHKLKVKQNW